MKQATLLISIFSAVGFNLTAQFNSPWTINTSNSLTSGYIGIGTKSTSGASNSPLPSFNFQVHGVADYIESNNQSGIIQYDAHGNAMSNGEEKTSINYGKTSRIGMTNSITGIGASDGTLFMMAQNDFSIRNRETGNFTIAVPTVNFVLHNASGRAWVGGNPSILDTYAKFNIIGGNDDGLYIQTVVSGKTALKLKNHSDAASAIEVFGSNATLANFKVFGSGTVYARKYVTTLSNFPDYVFQPSYQLMPLTELRTYISTNKHLPNMPKAEEVEENGADLGEMNRLLVEKVEELTLYILQLEERMNDLETKD